MWALLDCPKAGRLSARVRGQSKQQLLVVPAVIVDLVVLLRSAGPLQSHRCSPNLEPGRSSGWSAAWIKPRTVVRTGMSTHEQSRRWPRSGMAVSHTWQGCRRFQAMYRPRRRELCKVRMRQWLYNPRPGSRRLERASRERHKATPQP